MKELAEYSRSCGFTPQGGIGRMGDSDFDLTNKASMAKAKKWARRYDDERFWSGASP